MMPSGSSSATRRTAKKAKVMQLVSTVFDGGEVPPLISDAIVQHFSGQVAAQVDVPHTDPPPSAFAWRKTWKRYQFQQPPRFLAYRGPISVRPPISLVLLHDNFSKFALDLENENLELSDADYEMSKDVYTMFSEGFDDELQEMNEGKLSERFQLYMDALPVRQLASIKMDGLMLQNETGRSFVIAFEDKTDDGPNGYFEGLEICRRVFLLKYGVSHGILVLRACPYIIINALLMDRKENVLLSEPLAHIPFWGPEYKTVLEGAKAMRALRNFSDNYVRQPNIDVSHPFPIAEWQNVSPLNKSGLVFHGTSEGKCMVAKFTQHYSQQAHQAWHRKKLAPKLYGIKDLGAGWKFVTMEYLSEEAGWHSVAKVPLDDKLRQRLTKILKKGHATHYVHGDFRPTNLLIKDDKEVQAIDFEWSGREGVAHYPVKLNPELKWEPTARRGAMLKKIHDLWHVNQISVDPGASTSQVA